MKDSPQEWVLLRGLTREVRHWGEFPHRLEARLGAKVHCLDLPGNGRLNQLLSPDTVEAMADWCHDEAVRMGIRHPCAVLAMSLGAMVATSWAQRHPRDVGRAVLINTSLRPFNSVFKRLRPSNYPRLLALLALPVSAARMEKTILAMTANHPVDPEATVREWVGWREENPVSRRNAFAQLMAAVRYRAPRPAPVRRLLLLAGEGDRLVNPQCSRALASAWRVPLAIHTQAGHDLPLDDPDWVLRQLDEWIASDPGP